jgi:hypothetical protein
MSLINDALKRAKNAQQNSPPPSGMSPMRPVEPRREERDFSLFLPVLIILLVSTAIFFISLSLADHTVKRIAATPAVAVTQEIKAAEAPWAELPAVIGPAAINTNPPPVPPPPPAPILVQGIIADPVQPWAIVNGKTVHMGDLVNGMRVTAIARNTITLAGKDGTNTLGLGRH